MSSEKSCEGTNKGEDTGDGRMSLQLSGGNSISDRGNSKFRGPKVVTKRIFMPSPNICK